MASRSQRRSGQPPATVRSPLVAPARADEICLQLTDNSTVRASAAKFFGLRDLRDPAARAAKLAEQFIDSNRPLTARMQVQITAPYNGREVELEITAGNSVGAVPLCSPTSARPDYGLVIQPRFPWSGIGPMLAATGWRVVPRPLRLPLLRRSERRVPKWVLSSMILARLAALLQSLDRRFETVNEERSAPRGRVDWTRYATVALPSARFLSIPCTFPDLRDDRLLKGAIRHTLEQQIHSLETVRAHGGFIHQLIDRALQLHRQVRTVPPFVPTGALLTTWQQRPMRPEAFRDGLTAIEWSAEERGLAGTSDLEGVPWVMPMEAFFEGWVETLIQSVARRTGGNLSVARKHQTGRPIQWNPSFLGSQRSLIPDIVVEWSDLTLIVDAKYKRHFEELQRRSWVGLDDVLREHHRHDLLQVLAYANLVRTPRVIACLAYPCSTETWHSLQSRGRLIHQAEFSTGTRSVILWLTAVPMDDKTSSVVDTLNQRLAQVRAA